MIVDPVIARLVRARIRPADWDAVLSHAERTGDLRGAINAHRHASMRRAVRQVVRSVLRLS